MYVNTQREGHPIRFYTHRRRSRQPAQGIARPWHDCSTENVERPLREFCARIVAVYKDVFDCPEYTAGLSDGSLYIFS